MSKKYKGKTCAYCSVKYSSTSADHVFAREFFPEDRRANLPKVPACDKCNNTKSKLETNLTSVLPFGANHSEAARVFSMVPDRLKRNKKLHLELASSMKPALIKQNNLITPTISFHINAAQLHDLVRYIVRGLVCYHWSIEIPAHYFVGVANWSKEGEQMMQPFIPSKGKAVIEKSYGNGVVEYKGIQADDDPFLSIWRIKLYGGLIIMGDEDKFATPHFWAISSSEKLPPYLMD